MTQILTAILIIFTFIMTLGVCIIHPKMHPKVMVFDSSYTIVEEKPNTDEIKEIVQEIPQKAVEEPKTEIVKTEVREIKKEDSKQIKTVEVKKEAKPITQTTVKTETPKTTKTIEVKKETKPISKTAATQEAPIPTVQTAKVENKKADTIQTLTEQQEIIAWNKWHSDIQNQLMRDVKLPILPNGTVFVFTFTVDKYGKITNIQTYSTDSKYTPYAIEYIAPVIRSYQGKAIVEFPKGSKRETTTFKGGWKLSNQAKYSRPEDYNDSEVIKR